MAKALSKSQSPRQLPTRTASPKDRPLKSWTPSLNWPTKMPRHFHAARSGQAGSGEPQGPHRAQSRHRRTDQHPRQARGQIPRGQGRQGRHPRRQVIERIPQRHSAPSECLFCSHFPTNEDRVWSAAAPWGVITARDSAIGPGDAFSPALGL